MVEGRAAQIESPDDFVSSFEGTLVLDAIAMRLQVIGELVKKIDKIDSTILNRFPEIEWVMIMRLRDIISHHYEMIDYEIIFDICKNHIPKLKATLNHLLHNG
ncbi:DUF86 domain-containing protein [Desulfatitalea sp. M08but]|uniref:DUF86 domain-containing protein n=2 Tax=Desulfatitalea alkaliphila TaxID=2929485 RepID=A0AA41UM04_9BACT|nr:HepT-like ribonuclease domain-containing protein [Desulfatitalea alkaliphila]MCJ8502111.1 DUF86 domain-containing protein [Desulfatitalea alkaliphila]